MTRINLINPIFLSDPHLMAEYRELPMVHQSLRRTLESKRGLILSSIPKKYTLNKGHVSFFYDKGKFLYQRYNKLVAELRFRGYNIDPDSRNINWSIFTENNLYGGYKPDCDDMLINYSRIRERLLFKRHWYKYNHQQLPQMFVDFWQL